jgi:hypothetical protein
MPQDTGNHAAAPGADLLDYIAARGLERPLHLRRVAALIGRAITTGGARVAACAPPGHGKSTLAVHAAAMVLETRREAIVGYFTHNWASAQGAATRIVQATRVAMHSEDEQRVWKSADGGALIIGAVGGAAHEAFDLLFIIDPVKNAAEAADLDRLRAHWQWLQKLSHHVVPGGSVVILGSRWSAADMIGCARRDGGWSHVNLPALDAQGATLWPEVWSADVLAQIRESIGKQAWAALYMGDLAEERCVPLAPPAAAFVGQ